MPKVPLTLVKGDIHNPEVDYDDNLPVNMYAVQRKILGADGYMIGYPGLTSFGTGFGIDRGGFYNDRQEDHYRISGTQFISVAADGTVVNIGEITGTKQASMPYSFNTQCIVVDSKMWLYDDVTLDEVIDPDLGDPIDCVWINGYYFLTDGEYLYHTDINDESAIDPLKFATAEFMPDKSLGVLKTQDNKVAVFGRYTIEYFTDTAQANFAFTRIESRAQKIGIVATHAKCELGGNMYIVGGPREEDVGVYKTRASSAQKMSTRQVDKIIGAYTEPELADIRMECRFEDNTMFIIVHLPNETLVFNESIAGALGIGSAWTILKTDVTGNINYRGINTIFDPRNSNWICGDIFNTNIGIVDSSVVTHYGEMVEWILYTPFITLETASVDEIEIETVPGFSNSLESVAISITHDGTTFGTEYWVDYSEIGSYDTRFIVRRLGYVGEWVGFKFRGASLYKMAFATLSVTFS
jgi:hypothetical protein